jgi:hypothetical protein
VGTAKLIKERTAIPPRRHISKKLIVGGTPRFSLYPGERVDWGGLLWELRPVAKGIKFAKGKLFTHDKHYAG